MVNTLKMGTQSGPEADYLAKVHGPYLWLLAAHLPLMLGLAWHFETSYLEGIVLWALTLSVPAYAVVKYPHARATSCLLAFASICVSGILIHLAKGMIEYHFHIFVVLAWLIVFANPWAMITAALTAAVHHLGLFVLLPTSVFNYEASIWIVLLHAAFVVGETIGNLFITRRLFNLISGQGEFQARADQMREAVNVLAEQFESTAREFSEQATHLQSASAALVELNASTDDTASYAQKASNSASEVSKAVRKGQDIMSTLRERVEGLQGSAVQTGDEISNSFGKIEELLEFFSEIETKTKLINDIVFQTRLLSFNASVEAARAGEHGKGFAVVAEEVGNLAQMSGKAAEEINRLLSSGVKRSKDLLSAAVSDAKSSIDRITAHVDQSHSQTQTTMDSFGQITSMIGETVDRLSEIAAANKEQQGAVNQASDMVARVASTATSVSERSIERCRESKQVVDRCLGEIEQLLSSLGGSGDLEMDHQGTYPGDPMQGQDDPEIDRNVREAA